MVVTKKKRYYNIKRANGDFNVYLFWGWKKWFTHTTSTYEDARRIGKDWVKATPKED